MKYLASLLLVVSVFVACKKKAAPINNSPSDNSSNITVTLSSDKPTMRFGQQCHITATVTGATGSCSYQWQVNTASAITGSGNYITLSACCEASAGDNNVTCTITDANGNKGTGHVTVIVNP